MSTSDSRGRDDRATASFDTTRVAVAIVDAKGLIVCWTPAAEAVLGYQAAEVLGQPVVSLLSDDADPTEVDATVRGTTTDRGRMGMARLRRRDGREFFAALWTWPLLNAERTGHRLLAAVDVVQTPWWEVSRSMLERLLDNAPMGMAVLGPDLRYLWVNDALERIGGVTREERLGKRISEVLPHLDYEAVETQARIVLETGQPALDREHRGRTRSDRFRDHMFSTSFFRLDDPTGRVLGVCYVVLDVSERWRARRRLALLNEVGTRTGSTLNVTRACQELADSGVPQLADLVAVDLLDAVARGDIRPRPAGGVPQLRRTAVQSVLTGAPESSVAVGEIIDVPANSPLARTLARGESQLARRADCDLCAEAALDATSQPERDSRSMMIVPIRAHGNVLGAATFIRRWSPSPFERDDLLLAEEVVSRAAINIDNARRFTREHSMALTLQRNLLPHRLSATTSLEVASRYLPADASDGVGGDWFDVIPLSGARVALVIGDMVGHGINAAASMGRLRVAVRTLADMDLPPDEILARLDDLVLGLADDALDPGAEEQTTLGASCLYAVYDPVARTCAMARAGHPPPAIVAPDGSVSFPELPAGPPLGLGGLPFESAEFHLAEGTVLALYTDGLIEIPDGDVESGLARLREVLSKPDLPVDRLCGKVLESMLTGPPIDDVALLVARTHALDVDHVGSWWFPPDPAVVADARSLAAHQLEVWGLEEMVPISELIVSELVTNAIRHGSGPVRVRLIRQAALICEVSDSSSTSPRLRHARTTDEEGRGLFLVAQLAKRWGTRYVPGGKTIWAQQDLPPSAAAA